MKNKKILWRLLLIVGIIFLGYFYIPNYSSVYILTVFNGALIYFVACLGVSVIVGMGGLVSFASVAFMGFGAYFSTNLSMRLNLNSMVAIGCSIVLIAILAALVGMILLRLKGTFFTFGTVALTLISSSLFMNIKEFTGGPDGIAGVPAYQIGSFIAKDSADNFYVLITVSIICAIFVMRLRKTNLGRALSSVRDNEIAAQVMGINVYRTKVIGFVIEAMLSGLAGALLVHNNHFVGSSAFVLTQSTTFLIMVMLGGVRSAPGVFVGALLITMLPEWLRPVQKYIRLFYGLGVMLLMVFMPMGLAGLASTIKKKIERRFKLGHKTKIGLVSDGMPCAGSKEETSFAGEE